MAEKENRPVKFFSCRTMIGRWNSVYRRAFSSAEKSVAPFPGSFRLNRFSGTETDIESPEGDHCDESFDDFDSHSESGPMVGQIQKSKSTLLGGEASNFSRKLQRRSPVGRTRREEELFKRSHMIFDGDVRVRVMDVDRFRLDELHHYFMYTLVRRFPAEKCVKVASRIALFRDKQTQHSFESMSKDVADLFGPTHGAELTALFSRCYNTIPVAFMLDYVRRFGKFSRRYIALQVEKTLKPRLFDFVRYPSGVRPLPGIVTRPFSLRSFAWLLPPCSAKKYIFQHLLAHSGERLDHLRLQDQELTEGLMKRVTSGREMDPQVSLESRLSETMSSWKKVGRPKELEGMESTVTARQPASADDIISELEKEEHISTVSKDDGFEIQRIQVQPFVSPLSEDSTELMVPSDQDAETHLLNPDGDFSESSSESWWKNRGYSTSFFRYNKKSYRLDSDEGWKQIADPRGELPDYEKSKSLRQHAKKIRSSFARRHRQKQRNSLINTVIHREVRRM